MMKKKPFSALLTQATAGAEKKKKNASEETLE